MSYVVEHEFPILLSLFVMIGLWLFVTRKRGTPPAPSRMFLLYFLVFAGTISVATTRHQPDYGVLFAATAIALFQVSDQALTPRADLFRRIFTVLGAWWILYRA